MPSPRSTYKDLISSLNVGHTLSAYENEPLIAGLENALTGNLDYSRSLETLQREQDFSARQAEIARDFNAEQAQIARDWEEQEQD